MELSHRISSLKPSPTVALNGKAKELIASGVDVCNFAVGESSHTTPKKIVDAAISALNEGKTKYTPAGGSPDLRKAISNKLKRDNQVDFAPNDIVVGVGAKELLFHTFLSLLNEGDEVIIPAPYWVSYTAQVLAAGGKPVVIPAPESNEGPRLTPEMIEPYLTEKTKAIVITSPNNPAGYIISKDEMSALGAYLKDKKLWIIGDEIYEYLSFDNDHVSLLNVEPSLKDRYILVNGMSKGFLMTGWRVGYLAAPTSVVKLVKVLQSQSSTCLPRFIEEGSIVALNEGKSIVSEAVAELKENRDLAISLLKEIDGIDMIPPQGAFYAYIDIRNALAKSSEFEKSNSLGFSERLLEKYHVAMVPGEAFGTPGFLRLNYGVSKDVLKEGISRIKKAIEELV